jgi:hypothetical protein
VRFKECQAALIVTHKAQKECAALKTLTQREPSQQPTTALLKLNTLEEIRTRDKMAFKITFQAFYKFCT